MPSARRHGRAGASPLRCLVRDVPPLGVARAGPARHVQGRRGAAALRRRHGLRRPLPAADPPDRPELPQGAEQHPDPGPERPGQPLGHRLGPRGGTRRSTPSSARSTISTAWSPRARGPGHRDRAGHRLPVLARPSLRQRAPRVVPPPARRHHQVRREPAQEVPGHLSDRLRVRRLAGALGRAPGRLPLLDRPRGQDLPGRQPAHQAVPLLGLGDRARSGTRASRRRSSWPRRSPGPR